MTLPCSQKARDRRDLDLVAIGQKKETRSTRQARMGRKKLPRVREHSRKERVTEVWKEKIDNQIGRMKRKRDYHPI
jgi:hypothetical protein